MKPLVFMCLCSAVFSAAAYAIDYTVEFGQTDTISAGVTLSGWGQAEPGGGAEGRAVGNYGGFGTTTDNYVAPTTATSDYECRMVWGHSTSGDTTDYADVTFPLAIHSVTLRHLNGDSNDSFNVYVGDGSDEGWVLWDSYDALAATKTYGEQWFETTFTGAPGTVLRIDCTAAAGSYWSDYGQLAIDRLSATASCPFRYAVEFADTDTLSPGVTLGDDWGQAEPSTSGGNYGGFGYDPEEDQYEAPASATDDYQCRMVWGSEATGDDNQATVYFPLAINSVTIRHLNGYSDDSFEVFAGDGSEEGWVSWGSYDAAAAAKTWNEQWFETTFTGTPGTALRIVCTGEQGPVYWSTYGQLAIDRLWACAPTCPYTLLGDLNCDCRVDLNDLALLSRNWLINCAADPTNPACVDCVLDPSNPACCGCEKCGDD